MSSRRQDHERIPADPDALLDYFDRIGSDCSDSEFEGYVDANESEEDDDNKAYCNRKQPRQDDSGSDDDDRPSSKCRSATPEASSTSVSLSATPIPAGIIHTPTQH